MLASVLTLPWMLGAKPLGGVEDFCYGPYSTISIRASGFGNSSAFQFQKVWLGVDIRRYELTVSNLPVPGFPNGFYPINVLSNFATDEEWQWYNIDGKPLCTKGKPQGSASLCIASNLSLNSSSVLGGRTVYRWVGPDDVVQDGWVSLTVGSAESTDPAQWLERTEQGCTIGNNVCSTNVFQLYDYSDAPFAPDTFALPSECPK